MPASDRKLPLVASEWATLNVPPAVALRGGAKNDADEWPLGGHWDEGRTQADTIQAVRYRTEEARGGGLQGQGLAPCVEEQETGV